MTLTHLKQSAQAALKAGLSHMTVWTPEGWKAPKGFPRRELLGISAFGGKSWSVSAKALVKWCDRQGH